MPLLLGLGQTGMARYWPREPGRESPDATTLQKDVGVKPQSRFVVVIDRCLINDCLLNCVQVRAREHGDHDSALQVR
jgi:hypothetical protein